MINLPVNAKKKFNLLELNFLIDKSYKVNGITQHEKKKTKFTENNYKN